MKHCHLPCLFLILVLACGCTSLKDAGSSKETSSSRKPTFYGEFGGKEVTVKPNSRQLTVRGVWISTVRNLDIGRQRTAQGYKKEITSLYSQLLSHRVNTVFFQVRSWNDAYYPSYLNPWSRWLTGKEGNSIQGLDPLKVALEEAHKRKLSFHAWLNPYRVCEVSDKLTKAQALAQLSPNNFARKHPDYVLTIPLGNQQQLLFLDPGYPQVRQHILSTIDELLKNYQLDGIHMDDYFYPYVAMTNQDAASASLYNKQKRDIGDWRRSNTDILVQAISQHVRAAAKRQNRTIQFGISPFGIWANKKSHPQGSLTNGSQSYFRQYADTRKWVKNHWVDYIVPQLYWSFDQKNAAFAGLVEWWAQQVNGTGVNLYIGQALYRAEPNGKWVRTNEIQNQLNFMKAYPQVQGAVMFRSKFIGYLKQF